MGLTGEGIQRWLDYEHEAMRWGVGPDVGRDELARMVEGSTVEVPAEEHRETHASDFARWGHCGGLTTLGLYGRGWFSLLALRRWEKVGAEALVEHLAEHIAGRRS